MDGRLAEVFATERGGQGDAAQRMAEPVCGPAGLLVNERGNGRQVVAGIVGDPVVTVIAVAWRQPMPAHFRYPHVKPGTRQQRTIESDRFINGGDGKDRSGVVAGDENDGAGVRHAGEA